MTPVRAAGTLDLTVHLRDPDVEPSMRPASGASAYYRATLATETTSPAERRRLGSKPASPFAVREWEGHAGATVCGRLLLLEELWVDHEPEAGDPCCRGCFDGEPVDDEPELWDMDDEDLEPERSVETVKVANGVL